MNENENNNEQVAPSINEIEQEKVDAKHVKKMSPVKNFALGVMLAAGMALGAPQSAQGQEIYVAPQGTVHVDVGNKGDFFSNGSLGFLSVQLADANSALVSPTLSYQDAHRQLIEVFAKARHDTRSRRDIGPQEKSVLINILNEAEQVSMQQLNVLPRNNMYHNDPYKNPPRNNPFGRGR